MTPPLRKRVILCGYETDEEALQKAAELLKGVGVARVDLEQQDFLAIEGVDVDPQRQQRSLFDDFDSPAPRQFDVVIANPPYVRTQVMGAATAHRAIVV